MRKKRWVSIFLTLALLFLQAAPAMAEEIETQSVSGDYSYTLAGDGKVTITAYAGSEESVVIPEQIEGARVTQIAAEAFKGKSVMKPMALRVSVIVRFRDVQVWSRFITTANLARLAMMCSRDVQV